MLDTTSISGMDRRKSARYYKCLPLTLYYTQRREIILGSLNMLDVSLSGLSFQGEVHVEPRATVNFRITVPGKGQVFGVGRVLWTVLQVGRYGYRSGVEFETLAWAHQQMLREYLQPSILATRKDWEE